MLQGFDCKEITGGASGALHQEIHSLELLDHITMLSYKSKLLVEISEEMRHELISSFRHWKGRNFVPSTFHKAICWSKTDPFVEGHPVQLPDNADPSTSKYKTTSSNLSCK